MEVDKGRGRPRGFSWEESAGLNLMGFERWVIGGRAVAVGILDGFVCMVGG